MEKKHVNQLPPSKRFKLLHPNEVTHKNNPKCLPAKKRAKHLYNSCTSLCLPAKKRIWAPHPLDFQIEEEIETNFKQIEPETKKEEEIETDLKQTKSLKKINEELEEEERDDGIICAVCQSTDGDTSDPIVFCDGCDLMVHVTCYGNPLIKSIPEGDWFCSVCESKSLEKAKHCVLCPKKGGALKPTIDNKWAHLMCAILVPEVFFRDPEGREGIECSKIPKKRWIETCYICKKNEGCVIFCAESRCELGFHVSCGVDEGNSIEYREGKGGDIVAGFCREHTELWEKQQLTGKFRIVSSDKEHKRKART